MTPTESDYKKALSLSAAIENELKRLNRWSAPLPDQAFENMGAFGQNTIAFEQWIQFILLDRMQAIARDQGEFPTGSNLTGYAVRYFDGDTNADTLINLLKQLDDLVEETNSLISPDYSKSINSFTINSEKLPEVVYALIEVLPQFSDEDLESQLQTYDMFLSMCAPSVRPELSALLVQAAGKTENEKSRIRIEEASQSILKGGTAAIPYNHAEAMKKFQEEHKRNFPSQFKVD